VGCHRMKASLNTFTRKAVGSGIALVLVLSAVLIILVRTRAWIQSRRYE
jgi:cell division protein FtsX